MPRAAKRDDLSKALGQINIKILSSMTGTVSLSLGEVLRGFCSRRRRLVAGGGACAPSTCALSLVGRAPRRRSLVFDRRAPSCATQSNIHPVLRADKIKPSILPPLSIPGFFFCFCSDIIYPSSPHTLVVQISIRALLVSSSLHHTNTQTQPPS